MYTIFSLQRSFRQTARPPNCLNLLLPHDSRSMVSIVRFIAATRPRDTKSVLLEENG